MSKEGGLLLMLSTSSPHSSPNSAHHHESKKENLIKQQNTALLEATVLDRLSKFKIADDDRAKIDNRSSKSSIIDNQSQSNSSTGSFSSTTSSGIGGSGELSPTTTTSSKNSISVFSENIIDPLATKTDVLNKSNTTSIIENRANDRDDQHCKSVTLADPILINQKKSIQSIDRDAKSAASRRHTQSQQHKQQGGGHLSPAEFFQMSRLRASALANKLNTAATFGGSKDLVTNNTNLPPQQPQKRDDEKKENIDLQAIDDLTKAVEEVKLENKKEEVKKPEDEKQEESNQESLLVDDGDLIGRSPVPVYSNNRHVQHPYKQQGTKYPQAAPTPGYCPPNDRDTPPLTPADYLHAQRIRAAAMGQQQQQYPTPNQQYVIQQQQQQQQQQGRNNAGYMMYQDDRQGQLNSPNNCYQQQQAMDQGVYSPSGDNGYSTAQHSPCGVQQQGYSNGATPPAWINQENALSPMSPQQYTEENLGNYPMVVSPFEDATGVKDRSMNINDELNRFFHNNQLLQQQKSANQRQMANKTCVEELPEALSDFILKYSRRYSTSSSTTATSDRGGGYHDGNSSGMSSGCVSGEPSPMSSGGRRASDSSLSGVSGDESGVEDDHMSSISARSSMRPESCQSNVFLDSPQSGCASVPPPTASPAAPMSGQVSQTTKIEESTKSMCKYRPLRPKQSTAAQPQQQASQPPASGNGGNGQQQQQSVHTSGKARQRMREMIPQHEFDSAWAWAMRCCQACPGSLLFRDVDGDSLLHIVVWHKDLAKIYAVTEILMKDDQPASTKPFDLPNKLEETPLFLAVEKRSADIVAYLLECGANPNLRARNQDGDGPLHYAAARGMSEIVQIFCSSTKINHNLLNGSGMTPLLCAVKNHGVIEEVSQCLVNNKPTIRALLKSGADPKIPDVASGKSVLHYCVERMDPDLVELFRDHLTKDSMSQLVNMPDYNGDTPLHILSRMVGGGSSARNCSASSFARAEGEEELRRKMLNTLIDCGADVSQCAGGLTDHVGNNGGGIILLYPGAEQDANDDIQFTILDSPESY